MKFTKGYWMNRTGVSVTNMGQVREVRVEGRQVYLFCVNYTEDRRSMDGPVIEMYISSPQPDVIRLKAFHFMGVRKKLPAFDLTDAGITPEVTETEDTVVIQSGDTRLVVKKRPCSFTYYYKDKKLTAIGDRFGTTAISTSLEAAIKEAYRLSDGVKFEGAYRRSDIGQRALLALK